MKDFEAQEKFSFEYYNFYLTIRKKNSTKNWIVKLLENFDIEIEQKKN
jgi:hypothetical protein